jgi:hypothetical protein
MTRDLADTVKALAEKLEVAIDQFIDSEEVRTGHGIPLGGDDIVTIIMPAIEPAIRELIAQEREACAKVCDSYMNDNTPVRLRPIPLLRELAKLIRTRGGKS